MNQPATLDEYVRYVEDTRISRRAWERDPARSGGAGRFGLDLAKTGRALNTLHELDTSDAIRAALSFLAYTRGDMEDLLIAMADDMLKGGHIHSHNEDTLQYAERIAEEAAEYFGQVENYLAEAESTGADSDYDFRGDA